MNRQTLAECVIEAADNTIQGFRLKLDDVHKAFHSHEDRLATLRPVTQSEPLIRLRPSRAITPANCQPVPRVHVPCALPRNPLR